MKKTKIIISLLFYILAMLSLLISCESEKKLADLSYEGYMVVIEKNYFVGDEIELNGQCITYYEDIQSRDKKEEGIVLTKEMISGFNTDKAGKFTFKIIYKNASKEVEYSVFEKPDVSKSYGFFTSYAFDKNIVAEIKENKVVMYFYENGYTDLDKTEPTTKNVIDSKVKADGNGNLLICFSYNKHEYRFCEFVDGIPSMVSKKTYEDQNISTIKTNCKKVK